MDAGGSTVSTVRTLLVYHNSSSLQQQVQEMQASIPPTLELPGPCARHACVGRKQADKRVRAQTLQAMPKLLQLEQLARDEKACRDGEPDAEPQAAAEYDGVPSRTHSVFSTLANTARNTAYNTTANTAVNTACNSMRINADDLAAAIALRQQGSQGSRHAYPHAARQLPAGRAACACQAMLLPARRCCFSTRLPLAGQCWLQPPPPHAARRPLRHRALPHRLSVSIRPPPSLRRARALKAPLP